jgi:alpha-galactosidase
MLDSINIMASIPQYSGPGGYNDADLLMGSGSAAAKYFSPVHSRSQFSLWVVMTTPLLVGASANMTAFDLATYTNRELLAVAQDPLGLPGRRVAG